MTGRIIICCLLFSLSATGQKHTLKSRLQQVQQFLDTKAKKKVDPNYIEVPDKPWRVIARYKENAVRVDYDQSIGDPVINEKLDWNMRFEPPLASSIGIWVGYRGTGLSYSKSLAKNAGRYFSFSTTGAKYGLNFRLRRFNTSETTFSFKHYKDDNLIMDQTMDAKTYAPVWIRSVYANGYYVFNGRRYSQAAAYNQSVIQRRSAGSFLLGATWYQSSLDFSENGNSALILYSNNTGNIKLQQANIGVGYGYNWVPFRGFVVNVMAMPTISVFNRVKTTKFDCSYTLTGTNNQADGYGTFNHETHTWANGETHKLLTDDEEKWEENIDTWETGYETEYGALQLNLDLRMGIAYCWKDYFVGAQLQLNQFAYKKDGSKVRLADGYYRFSLGMRF